MMKLSLSARIAEEEHIKDTTAISFEELANVARDTGFSGLCIRPSQATVDTPKEVIQEMRAVLDRYNLAASMVTLDPIIATNTAEAGTAAARDRPPSGLRRDPRCYPHSHCH